MKMLRTLLGIALIALGIVLTILPGSTLLLLAGLVLIAIDYPKARKLLASVQKGMTRAAKKLDLYLLQRKRS